jgi:hypothetical protein
LPTEDPVEPGKAAALALEDEELGISPISARRRNRLRVGSLRAAQVLIRTANVVIGSLQGSVGVTDGLKWDLSPIPLCTWSYAADFHGRAIAARRSSFRGGTRTTQLRARLGKGLTRHSLTRSSRKRCAVPLEDRRVSQTLRTARRLGISGTPGR